MHAHFEHTLRTMRRTSDGETLVLCCVLEPFACRMEEQLQAAPDLIVCSQSSGELSNRGPVSVCRGCPTCKVPCSHECELRRRMHTRMQEWAERVVEKGVGGVDGKERLAGC